MVDWNVNLAAHPVACQAARKVLSTAVLPWLFLLGFNFCEPFSVSNSKFLSIFTKAKLMIPPADVEDWTALLAGLTRCAKEIRDIEVCYPVVDTVLYAPGHVYICRGRKRRSWMGMGV